MKSAEEATAYSALGNNDDESLLEESVPRARQLSIWRRAFSGRGLFILNLFMFFGSIIALTLVLIDARRGCSDDESLKRTSYFSPVFDRLQITQEDRIISGNLFNDPPTIYRETPSKEVDAAWAAMAKIVPFVIRSEDVVRLGKDPKLTSKVPEDWGLGSDAYFAQLDGQHALHCLNAVRKYVYREHYYSSWEFPVAKMPFIHQNHLSHCLYILLQTLSCQPSVDVITYNWMETQKSPFPDFAIHKKCRNHAAILEWQNAQNTSFTPDRLDALGAPEDAIVLPALPQLLAHDGPLSQSEGHD
ncbi:hypothetical protein L228DRAFT_245949 [Xylona heveae TC161]|uniref:Tat pathway signal sequence n=1 Tax=Xylona heveae (strain CBS 132557 / TC161) TaxID=1328760 RepID=A0A165HAF8_XYLHT|nr:hypothetical protein L228DRAFT_245949 [Xylona heveae TC161]KZF23211.1 hypothetical protein L228DRAFT_245949 [Xylona heveae TC161]